MDLASSPRMAADDLDLPYELDAMRDASVEPSQEAMIEDPINPDRDSTEDVHLVDEDLLDDDDMVDEDTVVHNEDANHKDFTMESHQQNQQSAEHDDEDILYDDDELLHESTIEARDLQDVEIVDEEDLFGEDEEVQEHTLEDLQHTTELQHSNQDDEILDEEKSTNLISQDAEDFGDTQGPLFSGDLASDIGEHGADDRAIFGDDVENKPDHEESAATFIPGKSITNGPATAPCETANAAEISELLEPAKLDSAGLPVSEQAQSTSQTTVSQLPSHDIEFTEGTDVLLAVDGAQIEDESPADQRHTAGLHTVKVNYQDTELCLFPPNQDDESQTFFLSDIELAHQSLDKLLSACHDVLAGTIGDDDELVLDIPSLGLHISQVCELASDFHSDLLMRSQDSSYACQMTLSQILDVYLALSHNDQTEAVEPLYCHLTSRVSLASQHAYLRSAAEKGKTFAEIAAEHLHSHEDSPNERDQDDNFIESHEEDHEGFGQGEFVQNEILEHGADIENTNLEAHEVPDYHIYEGTTKEDVFANEDESTPNSRESRAKGDDDHLTGNVENEASATSTVRGDELEPQGEYDLLSETCYAHGLSCCLDCDANVYADIETSTDDAAELANATSIPKNYMEGTGEAAEDEDGRAETQSAVGDTESSRTLEAGNGSYEQILNGDTEAEAGNLIENDKDFRDDLGAEAPPYTTGEPHVQDQDNDGLLSVHPGQEGFQSIEQAAAPNAKITAGKETPAHADRHMVPFERPSSNGIAHEGEAKQDSVQAGVDEDDLFLDDEDARAPVQEAKLAATPSKLKTSKRKSRDEEDDFDLLDSGTPDIKRRRPS